MTDAYIIDAIRTPRGKGKADGRLHQVKPIDLATQVLDGLKQRNQLDTAQVNDVIIGCVSAVGEQGANIAKTAVLKAEWDECVPGFTLNRFCASGLEAVNLGAMKIKSGWQDLIVAGGVESMSRVPMGSDGGPWAFDPETNYQSQFVPQGIGADLIASIEGFNRDQVDQFAYDSHRKAHHAQVEEYFKKSIIPITDRNGIELLAHDETVRDQCSLEDLAKLKPAFKKMGAMGFDEVLFHKYPKTRSINHVHTAGNSSGIVDGSSLLLLASKDKAAKLNLPLRAKIVSAAVTSTEPSIMLTGPAPASRKALDLAGLSAKDIDLFEVNEAFAAVVLKFAKDLEVPLEKINVNGGAIAMGHPLGATGAMLLGSLLDELERTNKRYGLCTLCVGGGMGVATIIERI
ncbi:MAG: acetyl-CoA C-acetyltransferase [Oligoflexales bacterium]